MTWFRREIPPKEPPTPRQHQGLNVHQRRALNSTLAHLERHLLSLEHLIQGEEQRILIRRTGQLAPATGNSSSRSLRSFGKKSARSRLRRCFPVLRKTYVLRSWARLLCSGAIWKTSGPARLTAMEP